MKQVLLVLFRFFELAQAQQTQETANALKSHLVLAKKIYERSTGVKISLKDPLISQMAVEIRKDNLVGAAQIAVKSPAFTNVRARNFALKLSNKSNSVGVEFNDMAAFIVGVIRDEDDFRDILTSKNHYQIKGVNFYKNYLENITRNPASDVDEKLLDIHNNLEKIEKPPFIGLKIDEGKVAEIQAKPITQLEKNNLISEQAIKLQEHPDPAGILTTNYFAQSQYSGGSNRREIEFIAKNFLCSTMPEIGNPDASDAYVGKDVDRFVGGSNENYINNCKSCHTVMDGMRGAFAKVDYSAFYHNLASSFGSGSAYGSFANQLNDERSTWLDSVFNQTDLERDLVANGANSTLVANTTKAYNLDYTLPIKSTYAPEASLTYPEKKASLIAAMNSNLLLKNAQGTSAPNPTYIRLAHIFNRSLLSLNQRDVLSELANRANLKPLILIDVTKAYSATNAKPEWLAIKDQLHYFILVGDQTFAAARDEIANVKKTELYDIFANKGVPANITKYNQLCLDKWDQEKIDAQTSESAKNTLRLSMSQAFLICDLEFRKNVSFLGDHVLKKVKANGASNELQLGLNDLVLTNSINLFTGGENTRRAFFTRYLASQNKLFSFGGLNFNGDTGVANKMNNGNFAYGAEVKDDKFVNLASSSYGWRGPNKDGGSGMNQFGRMIADSEAFSSCISKKWFQTICNKDLSESPKLQKKWSKQFEINYKVKSLVAEMVVSPECGVVSKWEPK